MPVISKYLRIIPLLVAASAVHAEAPATLRLNSAPLAVKQQSPNGTLLATISGGQIKVPGQQLLVTIATEAWDENRGIYKSAIPGIGFSFCKQGGNGCLQRGATVSGSMLNTELRNYALRLYKIGDLQGGNYSLPALIGLSHNGAPALNIGLSPLILNVIQCSITRDNLRVTFPDATLSDERLLSTVKFQLPISCKTPEDYHNIAIHFTYRGKHVDPQRIETSLPGVGLSLKNEAGKYADFSAGSADPEAAFHDTRYVAELIRLNNAPAKAGDFEVAITAEVQIR